MFYIKFMLEDIKRHEISICEKRLHEVPNCYHTSVSESLFRTDKRKFQLSIDSNLEKIGPFIRSTCKNIVDEDLLNHVCSNIKLIVGSHGSSVYKAYSNFTPILILKSNPHDSEHTLIHEYVIGTEINKLRDICPYFPQTFTMLDCSIYSLQIKNFETYVTVPGKTLITEFINGVSLADYKDCRFPTILTEIFLQIFTALQLAHREFGFTHNDIHPRNVLISKNAFPMIVPVLVNGEMRYISTYYVVKIFDFGNSYGFIEGGHCGYTSYDLKKINIFPDRHNASYDIYKVICSTAFSCRGNNIFFNFLSKLFQQLFNLDLKLRIEKYDTNREIHKKRPLPVEDQDYCHAEEIYDVSHEDAINFILKENPIDFVDNVGSPKKEISWDNYFAEIFGENQKYDSKTYKLLKERSYSVNEEYTKNFSKEEYNKILSRISTIRSLMRELSPKPIIVSYITDQHRKIETWLKIVDMDCPHTQIVENAYSASVCTFTKFCNGQRI